MKGPVRWFVVLNATLARVLRGLPVTGEAASPELLLRASGRRLRSLLAERPGRSFAVSGTGAPSAIPYGSDQLAADEREFIRQLIALLHAHWRAHDFDRLTVVAPPATLGLFRAELPRDLRSAIDVEIPRNFARIPASELPDLLRGGRENPGDYAI